jgi:hypothetical protein
MVSFLFSPTNKPNPKFPFKKIKKIKKKRETQTQPSLHQQRERWRKW